MITYILLVWQTHLLSFSHLCQYLLKLYACVSIQCYIWQSHLLLCIYGHQIPTINRYKSVTVKNKKHYTHVLHISLNKYGCNIENIPYTAKHTKWTHRPYIFAYVCKNATTWNSYFMFYCKICARKKYTNQIGHICHIVKLTDMHMWGRYANIYITYELSGIITVHRCDTNIYYNYSVQMPRCNSINSAAAAPSAEL